MNFIIWLISGALVGWLASVIMKSNLSLLWSILLGIAGSVVGGFLAGLIGIRGTGLGGLLISVAGACLLLFISRKVKS